MRAALQAAVDRGERGVQVAAYLDGELIVDDWIGEGVDGDTLFNVFSVTKTVLIVALHLQAERGRLDYDGPVARHWPEYGRNGKERITVRHLLTHRAGVPQMPEDVTPERMCDWEWMTGRLAGMTPMFEPGTRNTYLAASFGWLAGEVVRRSDPEGRTLQRFVEDEIFGPLAIDAFFIGLPASEDHRVATLTYPEPPPAPPRGSVRARAVPPAIAFTPEVYMREDVRRATLGGAGGIANARSVARLYAMIANRGALDGVRLLSEETVLACLEPRPGFTQVDETYDAPMPVGMGGFHLHERGIIGHRPGERVLCHPGHGGSLGYANVANGLALAVCHNRMVMNPSEPGADATFEEVGAAVRELASA